MHSTSWAHIYHQQPWLCSTFPSYLGHHHTRAGSPGPFSLIPGPHSPLMQTVSQVPWRPTLLFVDDGLLISQEKEYNKSFSILKQSYGILSHLFTVVGLVLEHEKSEIFHFSRARNNSNFYYKERCLTKIIRTQSLSLKCSELNLLMYPLEHKV